MKIRPQTFVAGLTGKATSMKKIGAKGFYVQSVGGRWWIKKTGAIVANLPYTIESPTPAQMAVRVGFGRAAHGTAGRKLEERLAMMRKSAGEFIKAAKDEFNVRPLTPEELRERRKGYHTVGQLEKMLAKELEKRGRGTPRTYSNREERLAELYL